MNYLCRDAYGDEEFVITVENGTPPQSVERQYATMVIDVV